MTDDLSLLRCQDCGLTPGDVSPSSRDRVDRCRPCERRADHDRRVASHDPWYREQVRKFAARQYGVDWTDDPGLEHVLGLFADTRAIGGWQAVGVEMARPKPKPVRTRPCPRCGGPVASSTGFCAGCHFTGWWGRWANRLVVVADEDDPQLTVESIAAEERQGRRAS